MAAARAGWVRDEVVGDGDKLPGQPLRRGNAEDLARDDEAVRHTVFADKVKPELSGGPAEHAEGIERRWGIAVARGGREDQAA